MSSTEFQVPTHPTDLTDDNEERYSVSEATSDGVQEMDGAAQKSAITGGAPRAGMASIGLGLCHAVPWRCPKATVTPRRSGAHPPAALQRRRRP
jgi:hypothetical protein